MIVKEYWIKCETCGDMQYPSHSAKLARSEAKKFGGWVYVDGKDYCPSHAPNKACTRRGAGARSNRTNPVAPRG